MWSFIWLYSVLSLLPTGLHCLHNLTIRPLLSDKMGLMAQVFQHVQIAWVCSVTVRSHMSRLHEHALWLCVPTRCVLLHLYPRHSVRGFVFLLSSFWGPLACYHVCRFLNAHSAFVCLVKRNLAGDRCKLKQFYWDNTNEVLLGFAQHSHWQCINSHVMVNRDVLPLGAHQHHPPHGIC